MNIGSLFSGYLGLDLAVEQVFGAETAWTSDIDEGARKIIAHRTTAPNLGDITKIDWAQVEPVRILAAGWPCQPFSLAGKRKGAADERALWPYVADAVRILRPRYVVLENVSAIATAGELARATASLAALGYVGSWLRLRASDVGAPHGRARIFIVASDAENLGHERIRPARVGRAGPANGRDGAVALLPTPRATRGGSGTETIYRLGAQRDGSERPDQRPVPS
jgi:DNA (cytosine-5)-methyltransferase 1